MFVSAYHERRRDVVLVWERSETGRVLKEYPSPYYFYACAQDGDFTAITGEKLKKLEFSDRNSFDQACSAYSKKFESDLNPLERVMMDNYYGMEVPKLVVGFFDIEVDYDPKIGFASPKNPYAPVNAITLWRSDVKEYFTIAIPPDNKTYDVDSLGPNYFVVQSEQQLLMMFIDLIQDVDLISGWNSDFFDLPYIGKRLELLMGEDGLRKLAFPRGPTPRWTERFKFKGSSEKDLALDLQSRVHLDYMLIFKKFTLGGRQSFSLAAIAADELEVPKMEYEGTLYDLYRNDFLKFLQYNRRDAEILVLLEEKFKYVNLANTMVHEATVNFSSIFGSVALIDTSIINYCHHVFGRIVGDRPHNQGQSVEGAVVLTPKIGLHRWIGSCDINSLYPSCYRSLNLSPEKIIGQLVDFEEGWRRIHEATLDPSKGSQMVTIKIEASGELMTLPISSAIELFKTEKYALSAYGTILDQSSGEGLLPAVLSYWFTGRKSMQAEKKKHQKLADEALKAANGNKEDPTYLKHFQLMEYNDLLQGVRKVLLNSAYGATLNEWCRFHDSRLGASTTGTGRQITTHMVNTIAEQLLGEKAPKLIKRTEIVDPRKMESEYHTSGGKSSSAAAGIQNTYTIDVPKGLGPIYGDTDSCYFVMENIVSNVDDAVACADAVVDQVNESFKTFMTETFFCQPEFNDKIRAVREVVAESGILRAKKKYVFYVKNMEGRMIPEGDPSELKTQGSDIKISSTPEVIRGFLKEVTMMVLKGVDKNVVNEYIIAFRRQLRRNEKVNPLDYASVASVNTLDDYWPKFEMIEMRGLGRVKLPSNVRASFNHNAALKMFNEIDTQPVKSGDKIKMVWLEENEHGFKNIALSSDVEVLPDWFQKHFKVNLELTEKKLIDQKLKNIFDPIGWEVPTEHTAKVASLFTF